jgi:hypothetical protein
MFPALFAHHQEALRIPFVVYAVPPDDMQIVLETYRVSQYRNQLNTLLLSQSLCSVLNPRYASSVKLPSSGGTTLAVFGVSCVHL